MPLGKCYLGKLAVSFYLVAGAKNRKEERKERKKTFSFLFFEFVTCNLSFLLLDLSLIHSKF
jgi:hypothetical protein